MSANQENEAQNEVVQENEAFSDNEQPNEVELKEEDVLSFIKNRYNKEINTVDELFGQKETNDPLPEDVSAFLKYKKKQEKL